MFLPFVDNHPDAKILHDNLDTKDLYAINNILKANADGKVVLIKQNKPGFKFKLVTAISYVETGFEMPVLKWHACYMSTDQLIKTLKGM